MSLPYGGVGSTIQRRAVLRTPLGSGAAVCAGAMLPAGVWAAVKPQPLAGRTPDVILVVSDQNRTGLTKATGYPLDTSPALDRLGVQGRTSPMPTLPRRCACRAGSAC